MFTIVHCRGSMNILNAKQAVVSRRPPVHAKPDVGIGGCKITTLYIRRITVVSSPLSFTIYLEIVLSIKITNQKHGGFDVTVSLFSWGNPLTTAHA